MSSFEAKLKLEGKEYEVVNCNYMVQRKIDYTGRPTGQLRDSIIELEILAPEDDVSFFAWLTDSSKKKGTIEFVKVDQQATFGSIEFEDSLCFDYSQVFDAHAPRSFVIKFKLTTAKFTLKSGKQSKNFNFFKVE